MRNAMAVSHTPVARATIILFQSQMAILVSSMNIANAAPEEDVHAKHDQQRRASEGQVTRDLGRIDRKGIRVLSSNSLSVWVRTNCKSIMTLGKRAVRRWA